MSLHHDQPFEKLFSEQRQADQQHAPRFDRSWQAAAERDWTPPLAAWCYPALAAVAVLALTLGFWPEPSAPVTPVVQAPSPATVLASLQEWSVPTDILLDTSSFGEEPLSQSTAQP